MLRPSVLVVSTNLKLFQRIRDIALHTQRPEALHPPINQQVNSYYISHIVEGNMNGDPISS